MPKLTTKDKQGIGLIASVLLVAFVAIIYSVLLSARPKADSRNCAGPINRKTVFIIDQSDAIPAQTVAEIKNRVLKIVSNTVQSNELVSVFMISDESRTKLEPVFTVCKPPQDGSEVSENVRAIRKRFRVGFEEPLSQALATQPIKAKTSPLAEVIVDLSLGDYLRAPESRLVVFSDFMQNSGNTSLYGCSDAKSAIADFRAHRAGAVERPTFKNAEILINFIPREGVGTAVAACRTGFWTWFLGDNEGPHASVTTDYLPGGAKVP